MSLDAVFGLRVVMCLWIVRAHTNGLCRPDVALGQDYAGGDFTAPDPDDKWRVSIFILVAAVSASMKYENHRNRAVRKLIEWCPVVMVLCMFSALCLCPEWLYAHSSSGRSTTDALLQTALDILEVGSMFSPGIYPLRPSYTWYLGAQITFYIFFNQMQDVSKLSCSALPQWLRAGWPFCYRPTVPTCHHTKSLRGWLCRLAIVSIIPMIMECLQKLDEIDVLPLTHWIRRRCFPPPSLRHPSFRVNIC